MDKRIVMATEEGKIIGLFPSLEEASKETGFKKNEIYRCLVGAQSYIGKGIYFFYEVTAGELREENKKKRKEKLEKEWKI